VEQEPPYTPEPEQGEEPTHALIVDRIVPENFVEATMDSLNQLAADRGDFEGGNGGSIRLVRGTRCYTSRNPPDYHCLDHG
jgi:hypothetical protein